MLFSFTPDAHTMRDVLATLFCVYLNFNTLDLVSFRALVIGLCCIFKLALDILQI